jgi:hypothetical protein
MKKILVIERDSQFNRFYSDILKKNYQVEFADCIDTMNNYIAYHQNEGGLQYYDVIIMDPYFSNYPLYGYEETFLGMQTGWFVYRDFMQNLTSVIIIWTYPTGQYIYNEGYYPERSWGKNVAGVFRKDYSSRYLLDLVEKYSPRFK